MRVTQVHFEAFKSLYNVTCDLDSVTVITGPNGSGKSNLVDALNFLGEVYEDGLEFAVGRAGGYENIAHRRTRRAKKPVAFSVEATLGPEELTRVARTTRRRSAENAVPDDAYLTYRHRFSLSTTTQSLLSDFQVREDEFELLDSANRSVLRVWRTPEGKVRATTNTRRIKIDSWLAPLISPFDEPDFLKFINRRPLSSAVLSTEELYYYGNILGYIRSSIAGIRLFQLSPYQCRSSGVPTPNAVLERHGENLPGAADHLRKNEPEAWGRVQEAMRTIIPGLVEIEIAYTEDRRLALQFREAGVGRPWATGEISDGTIQALGLYLALFDSRYQLLVVEEPENAVHPWILRQFLDLCGQSSKQIIITTHSSVVLNYVLPSLVRLMSIANGRSQIELIVAASPHIATVVNDGEVSMFDAYDSGVLPQSIPRGFSVDLAEEAN